MNGQGVKLIDQPRNYRGRPVCRGIDCDIEVCEGVKYCEFHQYELDYWLRHSRELLQAVKKAVGV